MAILAHSAFRQAGIQHLLAMVGTEKERAHHRVTFHSICQNAIRNATSKVKTGKANITPCLRARTKADQVLDRCIPISLSFPHKKENAFANFRIIILL